MTVLAGGRKAAFTDALQPRLLIDLPGQSRMGVDDKDIAGVRPQREAKPIENGTHGAFAERVVHPKYRTLVEIGPGGILLADVYVRTRSAKSAFVALCLPCQHRVVLDPDGGPNSPAGCDQHSAAKAAADVDEYVMRPEFDTHACRSTPEQPCMKTTSRQPNPIKASIR